MTDFRDKHERQAAYGSANSWFAITPHDTTPLSVVPDALYCVLAGDVVAKGRDGVSGTFPVSEGQVLPIRPTIVTTGTTAQIIGLVCL